MSKIHESIIAIQRDIDAIGKTKTNAQQGFKFRGIDDVYNAVHPLLSQHGVFSVPRVIDRAHETYTNAKGTRATSVYATIEYTFYAEDGSGVSCSVVAEGTDFADKASNKVMAFAHKYAILQIFSIPTEDIVDGDADSPNKTGNQTAIMTDAEKTALKSEYDFRDIKGEIKAVTTVQKLKEKTAEIQKFKPVMTDSEIEDVKILIKEQADFIKEAAAREGQ